MAWGRVLKEANDATDRPKLVSVNTVDNLVNNIRSTKARVNAAVKELNAAMDADFKARSALAYHLNGAGLDIDVRLTVPDVERDFVRLREVVTDE